MNEKNMNKSETNWKTDEGECKISIEVSEETTSDIVIEQFKATLRGLGYSVGEELIK